VPPTTVHYHTGNLKRGVPGMSVFLLDIPDKLLPASYLARCRRLIGSVAMSRHFKPVLKQCSPETNCRIKSVFKEDTR